MSATAEAEQLYCANCSDPVDAVDEDHRGRCCHDLPYPWHRGYDGLYTEPSNSENAQAEDEDDDEQADGEDDDDHRPVCPTCGATRFVIHARESRRVEMTTTASGLDNEDYDDSTLWYDLSAFDEGMTDTYDFEVYRLVCVGCRDDVTDHIQVEQL